MDSGASSSYLKRLRWSRRTWGSLWTISCFCASVRRTGLEEVRRRAAAGRGESWHAIQTLLRILLLHNVWSRSKCWLNMWSGSEITAVTYLFWHSLFLLSYFIQILEVLIQNYYYYILIWDEGKFNWENASPDIDVTWPNREKIYHPAGVGTTKSQIAVVQRCYRVEVPPSQTISGR